MLCYDCTFPNSRGSAPPLRRWLLLLLLPLLLPILPPWGPTTPSRLWWFNLLSTFQLLINFPIPLLVHNTCCCILRFLNISRRFLLYIRDYLAGMYFNQLSLPRPLWTYLGLQRFDSDALQEAPTDFNNLIWALCPCSQLPSHLPPAQH